MNDQTRKKANPYLETSLSADNADLKNNCNYIWEKIPRAEPNTFPFGVPDEEEDNVHEWYQAPIVEELAVDFEELDLEGPEDGDVKGADDYDVESDYDETLPDPLTLEVVQHMAASITPKAIDRYRSEEPKVLTDVDQPGVHGLLPGAQLAMKLVREEGQKENDGDISLFLAEINDEMVLMTSLDDIRKSLYRKHFLIRSGITKQRRENAIRWLTECHNYLHLSTEVLHKTLDLLDSYLFLNVIVPMDYEAIAIACMALAYELKANGNPEDIYAQLPPIGGFYVISQIRNYAQEMKMRSGRFLCRCPTPLDYYDLYEPALIEFEQEMKEWIRTTFCYLIELTFPDLQFCNITACAKAALVLFLIRYILKKKCNCDDFIGVCEHHFIEVWPSRLVKLTKCTQSRYFLKGVRKYSETLVTLGTACVQYKQAYHKPVSFSAAFNRYVDSVAMDPKLTQLTLDDFGF